MDTTKDFFKKKKVAPPKKEYSKSPLEKAQQLYTTAYSRWSLQVSQDKNIAIAKSIAYYVINNIQETLEVVEPKEMEDLNYWDDVAAALRRSSHVQLYIIL